MERQPSEEDTASPMLPSDVAQLWQQGQRARRGPRPALSVDTITRAAVAIADRQGLPAVSMAQVARALGVTPMALYRYVASKDALLMLMADAVAPPPNGPDDETLPWQRRLEAWCRDQLALLAQHPWMAQLAGLPSIGPNRVAWIERGLRALDGIPVPESLKTAVIGRLSLHLLTEAQMLAAFQEADRGGQSDHPALLDYATILRAVTTPENHPAITAALAAGAFASDDSSADDAELGVTMLVAGVEAVLKRAPDRSSISP